MDSIPNLALVLGLDKSAIVEVPHRLSLFSLRVHDNRSVPSNVHLNWLPRDKEETDTIFAGCNRNLTARSKTNKRSVA